MSLSSKWCITPLPTLIQIQWYLKGSDHNSLFYFDLVFANTGVKGLSWDPYLVPWILILKGSGYEAAWGIARSWEYRKTSLSLGLFRCGGQKGMGWVQVLPFCLNLSLTETGCSADWWLAMTKLRSFTYFFIIHNYITETCKPVESLME